MILEAIIIFIIGTMFLCYFIYLFIMSRKTNKWISTEGQVVTSNIDCISYIGEEADLSYKANIEYQYNVDGKNYFSKKVFYGDNIRLNFSNLAKKNVVKYSKGRSIKVYYNPNNPRQSVLITGVNNITYIVLITSLISIFLSILIMLNQSFFILWNE